MDFKQYTLKKLSTVYPISKKETFSRDNMGSI
jgi:hypothetical protein